MEEQLERVVKLLIFLWQDKDSKTSSDAVSLLIAVCNFDFILSLCLLKFILSNTNGLSPYLQGENVDVMNARRNADLTIQTLENCREEVNFQTVTNERNIDFKDTKLSPHHKTPSRRLQALVGEVQGYSVEFTVKNHYRMKVFYATLDRVTEELKYRFQSDDNDILCALGEVCLKQDAQKKCFEEVSEYYAIDKEMIESEHRMMYIFLSTHEDIKVVNASDLAGVLYEHELSDMLPHFSKCVEIFAAIPASSCTA